MIELNKKLHDRFRIDLKKLNKYTDREDLKVVHYTDSGHIEMTNSLIGIRVSDVYNGEEKFEHGTSPEKYPDMNKLFDRYEGKKVIGNIPTKEFENIIEPYKKVKPDTIHLNLAPNGIFTEVEMEDSSNHQDGSTSGLLIDLEINESHQQSFNYNYLLIVVQFIRLLGLKTFDLYYSEKVRPVSFVHENLEIILAPIRVNTERVYEGVKQLQKENERGV